MGNPAGGAVVSAPELDPDERKVLDDIRDYGCQVEYVFDTEGNLPDFSYSIGFPVTLQQPEVIVFGLRREVMHFMVNEVCRQAKEEALEIEDGLRISGLIDGFDCIAREVTDPAAIREHFGWAIWYHRSQRGEEVRQAYQLVWPGAQQGLYPWDEGCDPFEIEMQPALYEGTVH
jgi:hypothetical protein